MLSALVQQISETPVLDWAATIFSIVYVILAARDSNWCWLFAAVGSLLWAYQMLVVYNLVSDALLQLFYFVMAGLGVYRWRRASRSDSPPGDELLDTTAIASLQQDHAGIERMKVSQHLWLVVSGLILGYALSQFALRFRPDAAQPYLDGITSAFSILATFLLIARQLDNWLYFIVIDLAYIFIYATAGAYLYLLIMLVYIIVAAYGYRHWQRLLLVDAGNEIST